MEQGSSKKSPGKNTVIGHDDYIEVIWDGAQNRDKVRQSNLETQKVAERLISQNKPVLLSIHVQNHPLLPNMGAFSEVLKVMKAIEFDRMVISGDLPPQIMSLVTTIIATFNRDFEIKYFADSKEALSWLKAYNP